MNDWVQELDQPTDAFFASFAARIATPGGVPGALREAVTHLVPRVDWAGYLPQVPHGLLGLEAVLQLQPHLGASSYLRLLAIQLHAFAVAARAPEARSLHAIGKGSGHWPNIDLALREHRASIAWGELAALAEPRSDDFWRLLPFAGPDMANIGHKSVAVVAMERLWDGLGRTPETGRLLLAWAGWLVATEPTDRFWHVRMARRLEGMGIRVEEGPAIQSEAWHRDLAREIVDLGLVALLDAFAARLRAGVRSGDLLAGLVLAASEKMLDARRELEGKTAWNLVYLSCLGRRVVARDQPAVWGQAAALVNFYPSNEPEDRCQPRTSDAPGDLLDAILDGEPERAMGFIGGLENSNRALEILAEAASRNDPGFNQSSHVLAVAAALDLVPLLPAHAVSAMLTALAKSLANSQMSDDLGRLADRALQTP